MRRRGIESGARGEVDAMKKIPRGKVKAAHRACTCSCGCGEVGEHWNHEFDMLLCSKCRDFDGRPHRKPSRFDHEVSDGE